MNRYMFNTSFYLSLYFLIGFWWRDGPFEVIFSVLLHFRVPSLNVLTRTHCLIYDDETGWAKFCYIYVATVPTEKRFRALSHSERLKLKYKVGKFFRFCNFFPFLLTILFAPIVLTLIRLEARHCVLLKKKTWSKYKDLQLLM